MMKRKLTAVALAAALLAAPGAHAKTIRIEVPGLLCVFCAQAIEKKLRALAPAKDVFVSVERRVVAIALRDGQDIPDTMLTTQLKEAGYDVKSITRLDDSLEKIRADAKATK